MLYWLFGLKFSKTIVIFVISALKTCLITKFGEETKTLKFWPKNV